MKNTNNTIAEDVKMEATVEVKEEVKEDKLERLFWRCVKVDNEGNVYIKIPNWNEQQRMQAVMKEVEKRIEKERIKQATMPTIEQCEEFDELVSKFMDTDAISVVANKMVGRNIRVDWSKVDGDKVATNDGVVATTIKEGTKKERTIKKNAQAIIIEEGLII